MHGLSPMTCTNTGEELRRGYCIVIVKQIRASVSQSMLYGHVNAFGITVRNDMHNQCTKSGNLIITTLLNTFQCCSSDIFTMWQKKLNTQYTSSTVKLYWCSKVNCVCIHFVCEYMCKQYGFYGRHGNKIILSSYLIKYV